MSWRGLLAGAALAVTPWMGACGSGGDSADLGIDPHSESPTTAERVETTTTTSVVPNENDVELDSATKFSPEQAAKHYETAQTMQFELHEEVSGEATHLLAKLDLGRQLMGMDITVELGDGTLEETTMVIDVGNAIVYLANSEPFDFDGASWVSLDLEVFAAQAGVSVEEFQESFNPATESLSDVPSLMADVDPDDFVEIGPETIDGVETMHYRMATSRADLGLSDPIGEDVPSVGDFDVWVTEDNRVVRLSVEMEMNLLGERFYMLMEVFGIGEPLEIEVPRPEDVFDLTEELLTDGTECEEEITLRQLTGGVGLELELAQLAAARYEAANPCITIEIIATPDLVEDRLGTYLQLFEAQSSEGDVFQIDVIWPGDLAEHFLDLYEYGAADVVDHHFPAIIENNTVDGKLIGIPWFTDAGLLYYRTDLLDKYGLEPPTTWDELESTAQTIQDGERAAGNPNFWGFVWQGRAYEGLTCDALEWIASAGAGSIIEPDGTITINNQAAIDIVDQAAGWVGTISPPDVTFFTEEDARSVWQAGNAAFMRNWPYAYSLGNAYDSKIAGRFDVSPLPGVTAGNGAATLGGWQLAVSKYSEHPEEAADFALFLASYEQQKFRAIRGSLNPTIEALYEDRDVLEAVPFMGSLYDVFTGAVARPSTVTAPEYAETTYMFFNAVHSVLMGESNAEDAFAQLERHLQYLHPDFPIGSP